MPNANRNDNPANSTVYTNAHLQDLLSAYNASLMDAPDNLALYYSDDVTNCRLQEIEQFHLVGYVSTFDSVSLANELQHKLQCNQELGDYLLYGAELLRALKRMQLALASPALTQAHAAAFPAMPPGMTQAFKNAVIFCYEQAKELTCNVIQTANVSNHEPKASPQEVKLLAELVTATAALYRQPQGMDELDRLCLLYADLPRKRFNWAALGSLLTITLGIAIVITVLSPAFNLIPLLLPSLLPDVLVLCGLGLTALGSNLLKKSQPVVQTNRFFSQNILASATYDCIRHNKDMRHQAWLATEEYAASQLHVGAFIM